MSLVPIFRLRNVTQHHGPACVLRVDHLDVFAGEICCLLGPTGAGKTTLLMLLSGLVPASGGEIRLQDGRMGRRPWPLAVQRRITMVFQHPMMLSGSVRSNVEYGLRLRGKFDREETVNPVLDRLGLAPLASRPTRSLSVGQRQLVALARGLVLKPEVLLLDEPTANLDPASVALVEDLVTEENRQRGMTAVWATHQLFQARRVAHRTALILNGGLVEIAPTRDFFNSPGDPRTAAFVRGEMVY